ncbi:MAG: phage tail tape measure protein, partial [Myxococcaceae bacterium]
LMSATKRATLASTELALAKVREAAAIESASLAARAGKTALEFMGGPIGIITGALTTAVALWHEYSKASDEAREKTRQFAQESGANASRGGQIAENLIRETKLLGDHAQAIKAATIARQEMAALGGRYQDALKAVGSSPEDIVNVYENLSREDLVAALAEIKRLDNEINHYSEGVKRKIVLRHALAEGKGKNLGRDVPFSKIREDPFYAKDIEELLAPLEKDLGIQQQRAADIEKSLQRVRKAKEEDAKASAAAAETSAAATKASLKQAEEEEKAREKLLKRQEQWVLNLEEEARTLGKTKDEAKQLSDEYRSLTDPKMIRRADSAIAQLESLRKQKEETEKVKKAEEERARVLQSLNRELGNPDADKYAQVQKVLHEELSAGRLVLADYNAQLAKARSLWTPEGKAETQLTNELNQLEKQLNPTAEMQKRMEMVTQLFNEGRITAEQYRMEVERLQNQINTGFSYTKEIVGTATQHMSDAFANFVTTGRLEFSSLVDGILKDLARLLAQKAFMALVDAGLSAFGAGGTSSLSLGSARASGGPVRAAQAHLVGELGPELFIPSSSGRIVPNDALGGGNVQMPIYVTVNAD